MARRFEGEFDCVVLEGYGLPETSTVACSNHPHAIRKVGSDHPQRKQHQSARDPRSRLRAPHIKRPTFPQQDSVNAGAARAARTQYAQMHLLLLSSRPISARR
jgi:acyl-CoA synthetase (AMP-forming)/AMP-acid ligase II